MGWDISYHPISETQMQEWYFDVLEHPNHIETVIKRYELDDFYAEKYRNTMEVARSTEPNEIFDKSHGFYLAVVQGFFKNYFYTRGSALSFIEQPAFRSYYRQWQEFIPASLLACEVHNQLIENYCSGVFLPHEGVCRLLEDYETVPAIRSELDAAFSHGRIQVLLKALHAAQAQKVGLLEATEVVEPNPMDLNRSTSYSNLYHCDTEGPLLYQEAALEQLREAGIIPDNNN